MNQLDCVILDTVSLALARSVHEDAEDKALLPQ